MPTPKVKLADSNIIVKAEKVNKYFGSLHVLKDIDIEVLKNEVVVVIGPSGSGKSTFLRCINHIEKINSGHIYVNGHMIGYHDRNGKLVEDSERNIARQRAEIGMVFQRFNLFPHLTAIENIIEAPTRVRKLRWSRPAPRENDCWHVSAWPISAINIQISYPADNNNAWL